MKSTAKHSLNKRRFIYFLATILTMVVGWLSRKIPFGTPIIQSLIHDYAGDALWAAMVYWGFRLIFTQNSLLKTAFISLLFAYCIEITQLYHAECIDAIRRTTIGSLILGWGFLWSDLVAYFIGISIAYLIDKILIINQKDN